MTTPIFDVTNAVEVARLDDLTHDYTFESVDPTTGATGPLTSGPVSVHLSSWPPSLTPLPHSSAPLTHRGAGRWTGGSDTTDVSAAVASLRDGARIAIVSVVDGAMARYREAVVVTMRRSEV